MSRHAALSLLAVPALALAGCGIVNNLEGSTHTIGSAPYTQGSGKLTTDTRTVASFHSIVVGPGLTVFLSHGDASRVKVTADDNLVSMIKTEVSGDGTLKMSVQGSLQTHDELKVEATTSGTIDAIAATSGSTVDVEDLAADGLSVSVDSGSSLRAGGRAKSLHLDVTSGSTADLRNVEVATAVVGITSGSTGFVNATTSVSGTCQSGSTLHVGGSPKTNTVEKDISSTVKSD